MNNGLYDGLNHGSVASEEGKSFTGFWGDIRPIIGEDQPGFLQSPFPNSIQLVTPSLYRVSGNGIPWQTGVIEAPFDAEAFELHILGDLAQSGNYLFHSVDIGVGPIGKEQIILERLLIGGRYTSSSNIGRGDSNTGPFPIFIPKGSRVAWRINLEDTSLGAPGYVFTHIMIHLHRYYPRSGTRGVLISGQTNTPGAADTEGSYSTIGYAPFDTTWVIPCWASSNVALGITYWAMDYAYVEKDGTVVEFLEDIQGQSLSTEQIWFLHKCYPVKIEAGTEIQARGRYGNTGSANANTTGLICIGSPNVDTGRRPIGPISLAN